ncbi:hypothetical protein MASR1M101_00350 [Gemmatimonas sp.]
MTTPTLLLAAAILVFSACYEKKPVKHAVKYTDTTITTRWVALSPDGYRCTGMSDSVAVGDTLACNWGGR